MHVNKPLGTANMSNTNISARKYKFALFYELQNTKYIIVQIINGHLDYDNWV